MAHAPRSPHVPARAGLRASCVALPAGAAWPGVLDFLTARLPALTRAEWQQRLAAGDVLDEHGQSLSPAAPYRGGSRLYYWRQVPDEPVVPGEERIVFQDEHLVVADKPPFLPVTPGGRYAQHTLLTRLQRRLGLDTLVPLHRIDRETAGLVAFCVRQQERNAYHALVRAQGLRKRYEAIAPALTGRTWPLVHRSRVVEQPDAFFRMHEAPGEPNSETVIELVQTAGALARYALNPVSGRRHQLRVHMAALGAPIVGDRFYPQVLERADEHPRFDAPLQLLARTLGFTDPVTGAERHFVTTQRLELAPAP